MINFIKIYWGHLKSSRKSILISTIGLIFAVAIISSSILYVDTAKKDIIDTIINYSSDNPYEIEFQIETGDTNVSFDSVNTQINNLGKEILNLAKINFLENLELFNSISLVQTPRITFLANGTQFLVNRSLLIVELNNNIKHDLQRYLNTNSSLPSSSNTSTSQGFLLDVYFGDLSDNIIQKIDQENIGNYSQGKPINIYTFFGQSSKSFTVNLSGYGKVVNYNQFDKNKNIYTINYNDQLYPTLAKLWKIEPFGTSSSYLFVNNLTQFVLNHESDFYYKSNITNLNIDGFNGNIYGGYKINYNKFDPFTIGSKLNDIKNLRTTIQDKIFETDFYKNLDKSTTHLSIQFIDYSKLSDVLNVVYQILYDMFLYALPMIVVALLVTNFSFGLIQKRILSQIGIYKTRGTKTQTLFFFQLIDYLIIILGATIVGMLLGIPITDVVTRTSSILNFSNTKSYDVLTNFLTILPYFFLILFIVAIVLGFIVSIRRIIHISKISIFESENPIEKQDPYWKVHYIDVILFLYGLVSYLVINYFFNSSANSVQSLQAGLFLLIFFLPGPFAIVIGTILLANRFIPMVLDFIGTNLWQKHGGLLAFSFKNIIRHRHSSTRGVILVATLVTFLILFYTIPSSQLHYENMTSQYELGGELQITPANTNAVQQINASKAQTTNFINLIESHFTSSIRGISPVLKLNVYSQQYSYVFLFINATTFYNASSASLFNLGLKHPLKNDLQQLAKNDSDNSVIVPDNYLQKSDSKIGGFFGLDFGMGISQFSDSFNIVDSYKEWPMTARNQLDIYNIYIIMDISYFYNVLAPHYESSNVYPYYTMKYVVNFKEGTDITATSDDISQITSSNVIQAKTSLQNWDQISILIFKFRLGQINIDLIISLMISVAILLMFAYLQLIDRRQEIFTERAIGMKINQTAFIFYIESIILLFCGMIIGSVISIYFMQTLAIFLTGGYSIPPYEIIVPINLVIWTYIILIIVSSVCSFIPSYFLGRNDIIQTFAYEN